MSFFAFCNSYFSLSTHFSRSIYFRCSVFGDILSLSCMRCISFTCRSYFSSITSSRFLSASLISSGVKEDEESTFSSVFYNVSTTSKQSSIYWPAAACHSFKNWFAWDLKWEQGSFASSSNCYNIVVHFSPCPCPCCWVWLTESLTVWRADFSWQAEWWMWTWLVGGSSFSSVLVGRDR